jgi:hypothetical protein
LSIAASTAFSASSPFFAAFSSRACYRIAARSSGVNPDFVDSAMTIFSPDGW